MDNTLDETKIRQMIQEEIRKNLRSASALVPIHLHNGLDSLQVAPADLLGFPIRTSAPTENAKEGTIVLSLITGSYGLWARINKTWKGVELT